jgi:Flp pilus assembly protein TadD
MTGSRAEALRALLQKRPDDPRLLFGLAVEELNAGQWETGVGTLQRYLSVADDEGNAWARLAEAFVRLDRVEEAQSAYRSGIEAATRHGHPSLAAELEEALSDLA